VTNSVVVIVINLVTTTTVMSNITASIAGLLAYGYDGTAYMTDSSEPVVIA
jgi:hypothetical protein